MLLGVLILNAILCLLAGVVYLFGITLLIFSIPVVRPGDVLLTPAASSPHLLRKMERGPNLPRTHSFLPTSVD